MPYFLNIINTISIFLMLSVYFVYNIVNPDKKKHNPKVLHYEIAVYIYIAILASLVNIMNSINLSDAVFWYGVSLSFGVKSAIFIVVIAGLLIAMSIYFSASSQQELINIESLIKALQESVINAVAKQALFDEMSKDFKKRFAQIATPEEVDAKIKEMVKDHIDNITSDIQHLSDKTAIIAEQLAAFKEGREPNVSSSHLPSVINTKDKYNKYDDNDDNSWMKDDDDNDNN